MSVSKKLKERLSEKDKREYVDLDDSLIWCVIRINVSCFGIKDCEEPGRAEAYLENIRTDADTIIRRVCEMRNILERYKKGDKE